METSNFNERKLFDIFLAGENSFYSFATEPIIYGDYVIATDGYSAVFVKENITNGIYKRFNRKLNEYADSGYSLIISIEVIKKAIDRVPTLATVKNENEEIECPECNGSGMVTWEYSDNNNHYHTMDYDCPICNGLGIIDSNKCIVDENKVKDEFSLIGFGPINISVEDAIKLYNAMAIIGIDTCEMIGYTNSNATFRLNEDIFVVITRSLINEKVFRIF